MAIFYPAQGRNYLMDVVLNTSQPKITSWYVVPYEGDYTPQNDDTAANIGARATEITAYSETTRPEFVKSTANNGLVNNTGSLAQFTLTTNKTIRGFAILSSAGKGTGTGVLLAIQKLATPKAYSVGDVVKIPVIMSLSNPL